LYLPGKDWNFIGNFLPGMSDFPILNPYAYLDQLFKRIIMMKNKSLLAVSAFITVFVITIGIGVITKVSAKNLQTNSSPTVDATAFAQRENEYQQIIYQANQQLEQANQQIATLAGQTLPAPTSQATSEYLFTAEQADSIAAQVAGTAPSSLPELVNYSGTPAYEVVYANGNIYIDANTGEVLFNGLQVTAANISSERALYIAMNYLPNSQPVSMNVSTFNGARVYVITFSDGQSVFVDMTGTVVAVQMAAPSQSQPSTNSGSNDHYESPEHDDD
jgi:uncharacterized membrane protein YkoI